MADWDDDETVEEDHADDPLFSVLIDPDQLEKMDILWAEEWDSG